MSKGTAGDFTGTQRKYFKAFNSLTTKMVRAILIWLRKESLKLLLKAIWDTAIEGSRNWLLLTAILQKEKVTTMETSLV